MPGDVLVIDDEADIRDLISDILQEEGYCPRVANDSTTAIEAVNQRVPSAVVLDIWLQGSQLDGLGILEAFKKSHPNLPVIMISGHGNIETAINSIKLGAYDFIEKPFKEERLISMLRRAIENAKLKDENAQLRIRGGYENHLIGKSQAVTLLKNSIERIAPTESRVMVTGPAGCGKEAIARLIHQKSKRAKEPFVILNAASISPARVEEELFGIEENIISGGERKVGTFEKAHGGTLFLDEIADMPLATQGKVLRILQNNVFERVGGNRQVEVNVRVIASTSKDLQKLIKEGKFREDLYYRLNVVPVKIPSLKERKGDLKPLVDYFVKTCSSHLGVIPRKFSDNAITAMELYDWPGNLRQLRNVVEWILIMASDNEGSEDGEISSSALPPEITSSSPIEAGMSDNMDLMSLPLRDAREIFEKQYLTAQLNRFEGNVSRTANFVKMERSAFHRKLKALGIGGGQVE